ncbi:MAG TPA: lycopene cyclase family protein [Chitinophagaceae bacterium]|nr:lycopene cyclase family protein [Chitinophagaceae bacterium]
MSFQPVHSVQRTQYDFIVTGAGAAGLSLLLHMIRSGRFRDKRILLVEKASKQSNDRTWCFWEEQPGMFEEIVYRRWDTAWLYGQDYAGRLQLSPYQYKMIRGLDFYRYCLAAIGQEASIDLVAGEVTALASTASGATVQVDGRLFTGTYVFNSILFQPVVPGRKDAHLLQHFKGWVLETGQPVFNPAEAVLMDFRVPQHNGATFVYVMPFAANRALVEYTLFSKALLPTGQYDAGLRSYLRDVLQVDDYTVTEEEFGVIPMTSYRFPTRQGRILHIGTAGGQTKASSGYTFSFIQKQAARIVQQLIRTGQPFAGPVSASRFRFYDRVLLDILQREALPGAAIFTRLFQKNDPRRVLRFLDNASSLAEELSIISSLPTLPFLKAAIRQL